jgi:hypothetical protein
MSVRRTKKKLDSFDDTIKASVEISQHSEWTNQKIVKRIQSATERYCSKISKERDEYAKTIGRKK